MTFTPSVWDPDLGISPDKDKAYLQGVELAHAAQLFREALADLYNDSWSDEQKATYREIKKELFGRVEPIVQHRMKKLHPLY